MFSLGVCYACSNGARISKRLFGSDASPDSHFRAAREFHDLPAARAALGSTQKALQSITGAIEHTLSRDQGWSFLKLGEALERFPLDAEEPRDALDGEPFAFISDPGLGLWRRS